MLSHLPMQSNENTVVPKATNMTMLLLRMPSAYYCDAYHFDNGQTAGMLKLLALVLTNIDS